MADYLVLALNGSVSLGDLSRALRGLEGLVSALTREHAAQADLNWVVWKLSGGSAMAKLRAEGRRPGWAEAAGRVVRAYDAVGAAAEGDEPLPMADAETAVREITSVIAGEGKITSIRFETDQGDHEVFSPRAAFRLVPPPIPIGLGAVEGRIQTMSNRGGLHFTLYDLVDDRAVSCYLSKDDDEALLREKWGAYVAVEGLVRRDPYTGQPTTIRDISAIELLRQGEPGGYRKARGCVPVPPGGMSAEEAIRRVRDVG